MSLQALQSALGLLVSGARAAENVGNLTESERRSLDDIAQQPGIATVRMLYKSWRLTKILTLLPLTAEILRDVLADRLVQFWLQRPARGPYFVEECLAFLDFIEARGAELDVASLADVVTFERARLEMRDALGRGVGHVSATLSFEHEPAMVFRSIRVAGPVPALASSPTMLRGDLWSDGTERWIVVGDAPAGPAELEV